MSSLLPVKHRNSERVQAEAPKRAQKMNQAVNDHPVTRTVRREAAAGRERSSETTRMLPSVLHRAAVAIKREFEAEGARRALSSGCGFQDGSPVVSKT